MHPNANSITWGDNNTQAPVPAVSVSPRLDLTAPQISNRPHLPYTADSLASTVFSEHESITWGDNDIQGSYPQTPQCPPGLGGTFPQGRTASIPRSYYSAVSGHAGQRSDSTRQVGAPRLHIDTLVISVRGGWQSALTAAAVSRAYDQSCSCYWLLMGCKSYKVKRGGVKEKYKLILKHHLGCTVRIGSIFGMKPCNDTPQMQIQFTSEQCQNLSPEALERLALSIAKELNYFVREVYISRLDIACDLKSYSIAEVTEGVPTGCSFRGGGCQRETYSLDTGEVLGLNNYTADGKPYHYSIYQKYTSDLTPFTRTELRMHRKWLVANEFESVKDLTESKIDAAWHHFSHKYIHYVEDSPKSRKKDTTTWQLVQSAAFKVVRPNIPTVSQEAVVESDAVTDAMREMPTCGNEKVMQKPTALQSRLLMTCLLVHVLHQCKIRPMYWRSQEVQYGFFNRGVKPLERLSRRLWCCYLLWLMCLLFQLRGRGP